MTPIEASSGFAAKETALTPQNRQAIEDFEALLLGDVLKNLRSAMGGSWMGDDAGAGSEAISEMAEQQMVKVLASQDVLGLVRTLGPKLEERPMGELKISELPASEGKELPEKENH